MDTTKQNILMLEKAWEIQKEWKPIKGDFVISLKYPLSTYDKTILLFDRDTVYTDAEPINLRSMQYIDFVKKYCIWLPSQFQLQKMVRNTNYLNQIQNWFLCGVTGYRFEKDGDYSILVQKIMDYFEKFTSMEQLWLAFVMKELYQKIWDSSKGDWICVA